MLDFADWRPHSDPHVHPVAANWKVTLDTYRENYHLTCSTQGHTLAGYAHGGVLTFDAFGRHLRNCSAIRTIGELERAPGTGATWSSTSATSTRSSPTPA